MKQSLASRIVVYRITASGSYCVGSLEVFQSLVPGDRVHVTHDVRVGFRQWKTVTVGTVVRTERRRHSLHFNRNDDDRVFSDVIVMKRDDGELTTVALDEFSELRKL